MEMPPLICANCEKDPSEHRVVNERLICGTGNGKEWQYTDERRAAELIVQIDRTEKRLIAMKSELFQLMENAR